MNKTELIAALRVKDEEIEALKASVMDSQTKALLKNAESMGQTNAALVKKLMAVMEALDSEEIVEAVAAAICGKCDECDLEAEAWGKDAYEPVAKAAIAAIKQKMGEL